MIDLSGKKRLERSDNVCRAITGSVSVENVHPLQGGFFRPKDRRGRRPGMPIEPIWVFYLKYLWETVSKSVRHATHCKRSSERTFQAGC